jgi:hypothetical protein
MKTKYLKEVEPGDIITFSNHINSYYVYNIVLSKNQTGVSVLVIESESKSWKNFLRYNNYNDLKWNLVDINSKNGIQFPISK